MGKVSNKNTNEYPVPEGSYLYLARKIADGVFASRKLPFEAAIQQIIESHTDQANPHSQYATQVAFAAHAADTGNPHGVTAAQVGADAVGTAASQVAAHESNPNPHPQYAVTWSEYNNGSDPTTAPEANFIDALALGNGAVAGATYAFAFLGNVTGADGISMGRLSSAAMRGVAIGYNADAGQESFAGGYDAQVTGTASVGVGDVTVSSNGAVGIGDSLVISGSEGTGVGRYVQVTSLYGAAYGNSARSTHNYSSSFGLLSYTQWTNQIRLGSGYRPQTNSWDSQAGLSENTRRVDTTDATPYSVEIAARGTGSQQSAYVEADVICHEMSTGEMWHQKVTALLVGGTAVYWSVIGSVVKSSAITSGGLTVAADIDLSSSAQIKLQVTGEAGKTLTWTIQARIIAKVA